MFCMSSSSPMEELSYLDCIRRMWFAVHSFPPHISCIPGSAIASKPEYKHSAHSKHDTITMPGYMGCPTVARCPSCRSTRNNWDRSGIAGGAIECVAQSVSIFVCSCQQKKIRFDHHHFRREEKKKITRRISCVFVVQPSDIFRPQSVQRNVDGIRKT